MDYKLTPDQRDAIVKNLVSPLAEGLTLGSLGTVKDWLEDNTCEEHRWDSIWCCVSCGKERSKVIIPEPSRKLKENCPQCKKPLSEHSKEENVYTCPS